MGEIRYLEHDTPLGELLIVAGEDGLRELRFPVPGGHGVGADWIRGGALPEEVARQLDLYFQGRLVEFDLPLAPEGTAFMKSVWRELRRIPFGRTISYGELARRLGRPGAARAVGAANRRNPLPICVPCHRVVGSDGSLTGFAGGLDAKRRLLELEGRAPCSPTLFDDPTRS
jgi:methylated-DNA-[protein]-cysteine S-methyltransferase